MMETKVVHETTIFNANGKEGQETKEQCVKTGQILDAAATYKSETKESAENVQQIKQYLQRERVNGAVASKCLRPRFNPFPQVLYMDFALFLVTA